MGRVSRFLRAVRAELADPNGRKRAHQRALRDARYTYDADDIDALTRILIDYYGQHIMTRDHADLALYRLMQDRQQRDHEQRGTR